MKILKFSWIICVVVILNGCGFKVVDRYETNNFTVVSVETEGEKRVNYKLRNKILFNSNPSGSEKINLFITTKKEKLIKEKNIKNEITKYSINILADIKLNVLGNEQLNKFEVRKSMDYDVTTKYSTTLNNEKKIINLIIDHLAEQILREINTRINDL